MKTIQQRFAEKVQITPDCWLWLAGKDKDGYGRFRLGTQKARANRVAFELYKGAIPDGLSVLHTCDNPQCVNPDHLFAGTNQDNMDDKCAKGRQTNGPGIFANRRSYKGEMSPTARLTAAQVEVIRADSRVYRLIAVAYGVCIATISHIKNGRTWAH